MDTAKGACAVRGRWVLCPCLCAALWAQKPVISPDGVVNAATFAQKETRAHAIAPGSIVTIFGNNLARATAAATSLPLPKELAGTVVTFEDVAAPLSYVSPDQINAQVPGGSLAQPGRLHALVFGWWSPPRQA